MKIYCVSHICGKAISENISDCCQVSTANDDDVGLALGIFLF